MSNKDWSTRSIGYYKVTLSHALQIFYGIGCLRSLEPSIIHRAGFRASSHAVKKGMFPPMRGGYCYRFTSEAAVESLRGSRRAWLLEHNPCGSVIV